jgi:hypothetical protein
LKLVFDFRIIVLRCQDPGHKIHEVEKADMLVMVAATMSSLDGVHESCSCPSSPMIGQIGSWDTIRNEFHFHEKIVSNIVLSKIKVIV